MATRPTKRARGLEDPGGMTAETGKADTTLGSLQGVIVDSRVKDLLGELHAHRRHLHAHPELSFEEATTASYIRQVLADVDGVSEVTAGLGRVPEAFTGARQSTFKRLDTGTGVTAMVIGGAGKGPTIALRADMDALPITETSTVTYTSTNAGVMHACGHDGHVAMLLVAARILAASRAKFRGAVKLIFQPAEEFGGGAKQMVEDGVLQGVDEVYGIHLMTSLRTGTIGVKGGPLMAAPDKFTITVLGQGGHGAMPHLSVDAMQVAAQISVALQTIVSREVDPLEPAVVTIGKMENDEGSLTCGCGHTFNVICGKVVMHGTSRSFSDEVQVQLRASIERVAVHIAKGLGATATVKFDDVFYGFPATTNPEAGAAVMKKAAANVVGENGIRSGRDIMTMGGEDFSVFLKHKPGCFVFVGATAPGAEATPHHHPSFKIDERCLAVGTSLWIRLIETTLGSSKAEETE